MGTSAFVHNAVGTTGAAEAGARFRAFAWRTTTPAIVYTDSGLSVPASHPYIADGAGHIRVYFDNTLDYTFQVKSANDASTLLEVEFKDGVTSVTYANLPNWDSYQDAIADFIQEMTGIGFDASWGGPLSSPYITPQPLDATLTMYAALGMTDGKTVVGTGTDTASLVDYGVFTGNSATVTTPAVRITRNYPGTTTSKVSTLLLENLTDTASGNNYQSEVNLQLKAGVTQNFRRYLQWLNYDNTTAYFFGVNADNNVIFFDESGGQHWIWKRPANGVSGAGDLLMNATGTNGIFRIGLNALSVDIPPPTIMRFYKGGVTTADNYLTFEIDANTGTFKKWDAATGANVEFIIEPGGQVGIGKANPAYGIDVERTDGLPFRYVWDGGSLTQNANGANWITTTTASGHHLVLIDADNSQTRAILNCQGNGGSVQGLFAASNGNVGVGTVSPAFSLDVEGPIKFTPGASVTPPDNGDVVIEFTNNTTLTFKGKGSDGTVRSATLTLA